MPNTPDVVDAVEGLLGQPAHLAAFVTYVRTPGNLGGPAHCDYKRWRPVGSSMNWLFAIIPLTDFDEEFGQFLVSPGSHKLTQVIDKSARVLDLTRPDPEQLAPFIDPELKTGDLLLVNQHTWHLAPTGTAKEDRCGVFHKFCAANAPPAAGYYPYNTAARNALSDAGKRLIPVCFDKPLTTSRLLIERPSPAETQFLLLRDEENDRWELPGGQGWEEEGTGGLGRGRTHRLSPSPHKGATRRRHSLDDLYQRCRNGGWYLPRLRLFGCGNDLGFIGKWQPRLVWTGPFAKSPR